MTSIATRREQLQHQLQEGCSQSLLCQRLPALIAVSKQQPIERIEAALAAGHRCFGENRVQEAQSKWPDLAQHYPDIALHLIGPLQTNKVKEAITLFDVIHTLDRPKLADKLAHYAKEGLEIPPLLIQVNTGEEPQKAGIMPQECGAFIHYCRDELALPVIGLMCIPPAMQPPSPHFAWLKQMANDHRLPEVSMGMSGDYTEAIRLGATMVRIGTAFFGPRPSA